MRFITSYDSKQSLSPVSKPRDTSYLYTYKLNQSTTEVEASR